MATEGGSSSIGAISVEITGNNVGLDAALNASRTKTEQFATTVDAETARVTKSYIQMGKESTKHLTSGIGLFTKLAGAAGAVVTAGDALVTTYKFFSDVLGDGSKAADKFITSLGPTTLANAEKNLEALQQRTAEVASEFGRAQEAGSWFLRGGRSESTIIEDLKRMNDELRSVAQQFDAIKKRAALDFNKKLEEDIFFQQNDDAAANKAEREKSLQDTIKDHDAKKKVVEDLARAEREALGGPLEELKNKTNDALKQVAEFRRVAINQYERDMADATERAIIDGASRSATELRKIMQEAFSEALNEAVNGQTNQFGIGNMTTLLSQIGMKVDGIKAALPRRWG